MFSFLCIVAALLGCAFSFRSPAVSMPKRSLGFYVLIADDTVKGYTSTDTWQPYLYDYQIKGTNVLWLTFINPDLMPAVPPAMTNLAQCRGSGKAGCPPAGTKIIFSIGGYSYSLKSWPWLKSNSAAESMATEVATWQSKYGCDGVDLDIETGAGNGNTAANALVAFAKKLHSLNPSMIITQPVYGYPQVDAENAMVNNAFTKNGQSLGIIDSIGIMVYSDLNSLQWVKDYANATSEWDGFPITVDVPTTSIITGIQGNAASSPITQMANAVNSGNLGGFMVWFASVYDATRQQGALSYGSNDATPHNATTGSTWAQALQIMQR